MDTFVKLIVDEGQLKKALEKAVKEKVTLEDLFRRWIARYVAGYTGPPN